MLWLYVSIDSSFLAYSWTAFARGESGSEMDETEIGFAGPEDALDCSRSVESLRGTAVQPNSSTAGLLIVRSCNKS